MNNRLQSSVHRNILNYCSDQNNSWRMTAGSPVRVHGKPTHTCLQWLGLGYLAEGEFWQLSCLWSAVSSSCIFQLSVTRYFQLLPLVPGTVCLSTSPWHPVYQSSEHVWRTISSDSPFHDCKVPMQ